MSTNEVSCRLLLHAPNVHVGGGLVLLNDLLKKVDAVDCWAQIDARAKNFLSKSVGVKTCFVRRSIASRLIAELRLWFLCEPADIVLCFNGLPPLLPVRGCVVVFIQNRLLIEQGSLSEYPFSVQARLWLERVWGFLRQSGCSRYVVQTPSMAALLKHWLKRDVPISIVPFAPLSTNKSDSSPIKKKFDFVYVANGEAHKNHRALMEAWRIIAESGHRLSLALTLDANAHPELCSHIAQFTAKHGLSVINLGKLTVDAVDALYRDSGALIYPSTSESFGLPLIEATQLNLPILAPELDYVRDVVVPVESFDPNSPVSIARAVRRFLGNAEPTAHIHSAEEFLEVVFRSRY